MANYPRLAPNEKRSRKVPIEQYDEIRAVRKTGLSFLKIGKQYGIGETQARRICNPDLMRADLAASVEYARRMSDDLSFKEKTKRYASAMRARLYERPGYKQYHKQINGEWRRINYERYKARLYEWRRKNPERWRAICAASRARHRP